MSFADKLRAWMPLHENGVSRAVHFVGAYLFSFALLMALLLVPTLAAAESVARLPGSTVAAVAVGVMVARFALVIGAHVVFEKRTHGLSLGGPQLFFIEPVYLLTLALFSLGLKRELHARVTAGGAPAARLAMD
jgi:uncharacterized membrane protein YGL010W